MARRKVPGVSGSGDTWYATAYDPEQGRKVRIKNPATGRVKFPTQAAAEDAKLDYERRKMDDPTAGYTCDQWVKEWTTNPIYARPAASTNDMNAERVRKFGEDFKGVPLAGLNQKKAREWAFANKSRVMAVRAMLNDAVRDGALKVNPFSNLGIDQSKGRKHVTPLTEDEVQTLAGIAYELFPGWPVMGTMIVTAAYTGMRLGEVCALQWENVDWERGTILVDRQFRPRQKTFAPPKNGKPRLIVMPPIVEQALRDLPRLHPDGLVFYTRRDHGTYYSQLHAYFWGQVRAAFYQVLPPERQAKIGPSLDFHELRHFTASFLLNKGVAPMDVAAQLGHTDGGRLVQELYGHLYEDESADRIRAAFRESAGWQVRRASGQN